MINLKLDWYNKCEGKGEVMSSVGNAGQKPFSAVTQMTPSDPSIKTCAAVASQHLYRRESSENIDPLKASVTALSSLDDPRLLVCHLMVNLKQGNADPISIIYDISKKIKNGSFSENERNNLFEAVSDAIIMAGLELDTHHDLFREFPELFAKYLELSDSASTESESSSSLSEIELTIEAEQADLVMEELQFEPVPDAESIALQRGKISKIKEYHLRVISRLGLIEKMLNTSKPEIYSKIIDDLRLEIIQDAGKQVQHKDSLELRDVFNRSKELLEQFWVHTPKELNNFVFLTNILGAALSLEPIEPKYTSSSQKLAKNLYELPTDEYRQSILSQNKEDYIRLLENDLSRIYIGLFNQLLKCQDQSSQDWIQYVRTQIKEAAGLEDTEFLEFNLVQSARTPLAKYANKYLKQTEKRFHVVQIPCFSSDFPEINFTKLDDKILVVQGVTFGFFDPDDPIIEQMVFLQMVALIDPKTQQQRTFLFDYGLQHPPETGKTKKELQGTDLLRRALRSRIEAKDSPMQSLRTIIEK